MMNQSQVMMNPVNHQLPQVHIWNQYRQSQSMMSSSSSSSSSMSQVPHRKFSNAMNRENYPVHMPRNWIGETGGMKSGRLGHGAGGYDLKNRNRNRNRGKVGRFYKSKKLMKNKRSVPYAPHNTTSFLIRANRCGGIADLVSPYPVTPAILQTPEISPSMEVLGDMVKEEWGVDGYGSMNGLIRLKSPEEEDDIEMEKRMDHDLSRFEMIYYPNYGRDHHHHHNVVLENRVNDQDDHISELEKENVLLREKLNLMENEMNDLRKILQNLD